MSGQSRSRTASSSYNDRSKRTMATSRPSTGRSRPRTAATSSGQGDNEIICAVSEARSITPVVGLSFVNLTTSEAVLCQFTDTQTYARVCHKIKVFFPTEILFMSRAVESKLMSIIKENLEVEANDILTTEIDRRYWAEGAGHEYVTQLAFPDDLESLKVTLGGNYYATCCFSAIMKYIELGLGKTFAPQTLRIRFEPSEGSMMIDLSTITSLELLQNLQDARSRNSIFGLLNETRTKMGARMLRSNVLQPSTDNEKIAQRSEALEELTGKEEMFFAVRTALEGFMDTDRCLSALIQLPTRTDFAYMEQSINNVLMLKTFVDSIKPVWQALVGARSTELRQIHQLSASENYVEVENLIKYAINDDVGHARQATELRNQRVYAIRAGSNSFLDVARQTYKEINEDVYTLLEELNSEHDLTISLQYDPARRYYFRLPSSVFEAGRSVPAVFINMVKRRGNIEFATLMLLKLNQKICDAHAEVISLSDASIQKLIDAVRTKIHPLFKISECIALLDMLAGWVQLSTVHDYSAKPEITPNTLALKSARHPILSKTLHASAKLIPNDVYATPQHRFQIITGANMSGKSTYIRSIAMLSIMAQIGCFVPCLHASFPIFHQLFARVSTDSNIECNVSTFASEMRDIALILRNIEPRSLVIVDELGRGTSTTDGLAIAIAIAEALIESDAYVWFVTHFRDLARILAERAGVVNLHLFVDISEDKNRVKMMYKISDGPEDTKYYGIALAKAIDLPEDVVQVAETVSSMLNQRNERKRSNAQAWAIARRRKLVLGLKEQLEQAQRSMEDGRDHHEMQAWLKKLQDEFIVRLSAIEEEAVAHEADEDQGDLAVEEAEELSIEDGIAPMADEASSVVDAVRIKQEIVDGSAETASESESVVEDLYG